MGRIALKVSELENLQAANGMSDSELSRRSGISRTQLWRAKLPPHDERYSLGQDVIHKLLTLFPDKKFENLFESVDVSQKSDSA